MINFIINLLELYKFQQKLQYVINIFVEKLLICFFLINGRKDLYCSLVVEVNDIDKIFQLVFFMNCYIFRFFVCLFRWMQDVVGVNFVRCGVFMCLCFSCFFRKVIKFVIDIISKDGQNRILVCKFFLLWRYFVVCDDVKRLYLFQCGERWELVSNRYVEFFEVR